MKRIKIAAVLGFAVAASVALGACRKEEQGRILWYKKGVYLGKPDSEPSATARRAQRERLLRSNALGAVQPVPGGGAAPGAIRPPAAAPSTSVPRQRLRLRGERQGFN